MTFSGVPSTYPAGGVFLVGVEDNVGISCVEFPIVFLRPMSDLELHNPPYLQTLLLTCSLPCVLTFSTGFLDLRKPHKAA